MKEVNDLGFTHIANNEGEFAVYNGVRIFKEKIDAENNLIRFYKINEFDDEIRYDGLRSFRRLFMGLFLSDIKEQLDAGVAREDLVINIPEIEHRVKVGETIHTFFSVEA